jgi:hypothetical protein
MARRACAGLSVETPASWEDRSMLVVVAPRDEGTGVQSNIVVAAEERRAHEPLEVHADRQMAGIACNVSDFVLLERSPLTVAGRPAVKMRFYAQASGGLLEHTVVYVDLDDGATFTTLTSSGPPDARAPWRQALERMLLGARLELAGPPMPAPRSDAVPPSSPRPKVAAQLGDVPWIPMPGERQRR